MKISLVLPAFNEAQNIRLAVQAALDYLENKDGEVVVVDDGSTDDTPTILRDLTNAHAGRVRVVTHPTNLGYGTSLRDGFAAATGDWIFYTDSDLQFEIGEIDLFLPHLNEAQILVGFRKDRKDPLPRIFAAGTYNRIMRFLFGVRVRDIDCAFKVFRKDVFEKITIESTGFLVDAEILVKADRLGMKIYETGVTHLPRKFGESTVRFRHVMDTLRGIAWLWNRVNRHAGTFERQRVRG